VSAWAMTDPRRRYPAGPLVDEVGEAVLAVAVEELVLLRSPMWSGDAGAVLHALASLAAQINEWLPDAVADARDQDYPWSEIARMIGVTTATAQRRFAAHARKGRLPLDAD
jgi:hypothetical protein